MYIFLNAPPVYITHLMPSDLHHKNKAKDANFQSTFAFKSQLPGTRETTTTACTAKFLSFTTLSPHE